MPAPSRPLRSVTQHYYEPIPAGFEVGVSIIGNTMKISERRGRKMWKS